MSAAMDRVIGDSENGMRCTACQVYSSHRLVMTAHNPSPNAEPAIAPNRAVASVRVTPIAACAAENIARIATAYSTSENGPRASAMDHSSLKNCPSTSGWPERAWCPKIRSMVISCGRWMMWWVSRQIHTVMLTTMKIPAATGPIQCVVHQSRASVVRAFHPVGRGVGCACGGCCVV